MKAYILVLDHGYEGSSVRGAFSTLDRAKEAAHKTRHIFKDSNDLFVITEFIVNNPVSDRKVWYSDVWINFGQLCCLNEWFEM